MGTRADFYIGRGLNAEWIGSIAWDGYPDGMAPAVLSASSEDEFVSALKAFFSDRDDYTLPEHGWPWPWKDSATTDYAYAFDEGGVWASRFGHGWHRLPDGKPTRDGPKDAVFPDMTNERAVTLGPRSGLIVYTA